ncbi:hypothetical protein CY34DRAFT_96601 [Suillus luteus UH-Slu-Lm8-n1]|uniref:HAT C-terminal dimerisation domain-containing protein n=1 Tax=Suillus luteus UH-Slu-Lm8-n1 TaxID=930992 RepID=A0A0C9ZC93_9AGAM|nr:hypothetical protein CY34DRAFT_96601 [Suillus luteus UH-Slu-Lm8-n1]
MVIPAMDHIDNVFTKCIIQNAHLDPAISAALGLVKRTLNRYYSCSNSSEVYQIAMVLHPRHKLSYFQSAGWQQDWIDTAEDLVRTEFKCYVSHLLVPTNRNDNPSPLEADVNIFNHLPTLSQPKPTASAKELNSYLNADIEDVSDPIAWWYGH